MTYISKNLMDHPSSATKSISNVVIDRARVHYQYFDENKLWYINKDKTTSHIFHDGISGVEVAPDYVRFFDSDSSEFTLVDFNGIKMVRYKRNLSPVLYHPYILELTEVVEGDPSVFESTLYERHPDLLSYCLRNNSTNWTINLCENSYPIEPGKSLSMHCVKILNWFKDNHSLEDLRSYVSNGKVSALKFIFAV